MKKVTAVAAPVRWHHGLHDFVQIAALIFGLTCFAIANTPDAVFATKLVSPGDYPPRAAVLEHHRERAYVAGCENLFQAGYPATALSPNGKITEDVRFACIVPSDTGGSKGIVITNGARD